jgi:hypothetical protein
MLPVHETEVIPLLQEHSVCSSPSRGLSASPTVEAALGNLQDPTHPADLVVRLLCLDERIDHLRARRSSFLAKNVAAFSKISCSSFRTFTSWRRRRNFSFSSVVSPLRSPASISAWLTHLRSV